MRRKPLIASCTFARPKCRWVAPLLGEDRIDWEFFRIHTERPRWQDWMGLPLYQRPLAAWRCSRFVKRYKPDLLITQEPTVSHFCARFCRLARAPVDHVAFSFNFLSLPEGARRESMRRRLFAARLDIHRLLDDPLTAHPVVTVAAETSHENTNVRSCRRRATAWSSLRVLRKRLMNALQGSGSATPCGCCRA